jgi:magnesium transporter
MESGISFNAPVSIASLYLAAYKQPISTSVFSQGSGMLDQKDMADATSRAGVVRDEDGAIDAAYLERVRAAIEQGDGASLHALADDLHEADTGDLIEALSPELRAPFIEMLGGEFDFAALTEVEDTVREEILEELPTETVAEGVRDLDSDDAAYILEDLPKDEQAEILEQLPPPERVALQRILDYPENSAGRRMQTEFIAAPPYWTVGHAIDYMRELGADGKLLGAVALDRMLRSRRPMPLADLMDPDRRRVLATDDQEEVARMFERYNLVAAPVVDEDDRLVGVLTFDDVVDVIEEEAEEDIKALGGVHRNEELSDSVLTIARSRFPWLLANLALALISAWVISQFDSSIEKMVALAVLMPIVASMGGNAATQTITVAVRALATRDLSDANAWRVVRREFLVGLINGVGFALIMGTIAALWFQVTDLGLVIGLALICVLAAAAFGGIIIPLALIRLKVDPALASGPFVTTVTDVVGFFAFLGIATIWFGLR